MRILGSCLALLAVTASACTAESRTDASSEPSPEPVGPATTASATTTTIAPTVTTIAAPATTMSTTSTTTTTTTSTTTTTIESRPPLRTFASAGDSLLLGMLPPLEAALAESGYDFTARWFIGFLDVNGDDRWAEQMSEPPDILIVYFAPWELFALNRGDIDMGDPNWPDEYVRDYIEPRIAQLRPTDTEVIWIGPPPGRDPIKSIQYEFLNSIWRGVVEAEPAMTWLDGGSMLAGPDGEYLEVDDTASPPIRLFQTDGTHLCPEGGRRMTVGLLALLDERFGVEIDPSWTDSEWAENTAAYDYDKCPPG